VKRVRFALRLLGRVSVVAIVGAFVFVVGLQYARIIGKNVAMADQLAAAQNDVRSLQQKRAEQARRIVSLSDPAGVIPEIHDKLHLVRDNEAIIYLKKHGDGP
jgi:Tfp pilus assembly protein PilO